MSDVEVGLVAWAGDTDIGLKRSRNEDKWAHAGADSFVVADGVGGAVAGELAAETAVGVIVHGERPLSVENAPGLISHANAAVIQAGRLADTPGLASTVVAAGIHASAVVIAHVGDSRAYLLRGETLTVLTRDHSVANQLRASGVSPDEIGTASPLRLDALTTYLGMQGECVPDITTLTMHAGDRLLLCTDGVHGQVDEDALVTMLGSDEPSAVVATLLAAARDAGGRDNATAVVLDFGASGSEPS